MTTNATPPVKKQLPPNMQQAAQKVAGDITVASMREMFGTPILAYYALRNMSKSESTLMTNIKGWAEKYISKLPDESFVVSDKRQLPYFDPADTSSTQKHLKAAMDSTDDVAILMAIKQKEKDMAVTSGTSTDTQPNQPYGFPKVAPGPSYTPPGDKLGGPSEPSQPLQDDATLPDKSPLGQPFNAPGDKTGGPQSNPAEYKESDDTIFPAKAPPGAGQTFTPGPGMKSGLGEKVPLGDQTPETERHNPDLNKKQKSSLPTPPWDKALSADEHRPEGTPGLEFIYSGDDGHISNLELRAQEVDLFHNRYAKHSSPKDLMAQAEKFKAERGVMSELTCCPAHLQQAQDHGKDVFAYSYGQMRRSLQRSIRNFAKDKDEDPDLNAYHALLAMKADLLGETSQKLFAYENLPVQLAAFAAKDDDEEENDDGGEDSACMGGEQSSKKSDDEGENDMKQEDVKAGLNTAGKLQEAGFPIPGDNLGDVGFRIAAMSEDARKFLNEMAQLASGEPAPAPTTSHTHEGTTPGVNVAETNRVPNGYQNTAGGKPGQKQQRASAMGLFLNSRRSPMQGG